MPTIADIIIEQVCRYFQITREKLTSKYRKNPLPFYRKIASYFLRKYTRLTLNQIADLLGYIKGNSHATIIYNIKLCQHWIDSKNNEYYFVEKKCLNNLIERITDILKYIEQ